MGADTMERNPKRTCQYCPHSARDFQNYIHLHTTPSRSPLSSPSTSEGGKHENDTLNFNLETSNSPKRQNTPVQILNNQEDFFCTCSESSDGASSAQRPTCICKKEVSACQELNLQPFFKPAYPIEETLEVVDEILTDFLKTDHDPIFSSEDIRHDLFQLRRQDVYLRGGLGDGLEDENESVNGGVREVDEEVRDLRATVEDAEDEESRDEKLRDSKAKVEDTKEEESEHEEGCEWYCEEMDEGEATEIVEALLRALEARERGENREDYEIDETYERDGAVMKKRFMLWEEPKVENDKAERENEKSAGPKEEPKEDEGSQAQEHLESSSPDEVDQHQKLVALLEDLFANHVQIPLCGGAAPDDREYEADDEEESEIYEDPIVRFNLHNRTLAHIQNPKLPIDIPADEFYQILWYSKFPGFLAPIKSVPEQELEQKKTLYEVKICRVCGGYRMILRENGEQILEGRRVLMCGGTGDCAMEVSLFG